MNSNKYRIGDVSKMLHISDQMIRYYEKNGVIHPTRSKDGNYRMYSMEDVFFLFDAMRYKRWNINIGEISKLINEDYFHVLSNKLQTENIRLNKEIEDKIRLQKRLSEINEKLKICKYNIGKYWIAEKPEARYYYSGISKGDIYEKPELDDRMANQIFDPNNITYFDVYVEFEKKELVWWYKIDENYYQDLQIKDYGKSKKETTKLCLCTYVNMGEMGEFSDEILKDINRYMKENGYILNGIPRGMILGRGNEQKGKLCRIMELEIPVFIEATL